jgi:hypothetical protein
MEFGKKKGMSPVEKKAKLAALKGTHDWASDALKEKLGGIKKVSVAADSKEGLKKGLEKAEELVSGKNPIVEDAEEEADAEGIADPSEDDMEECSEEELDEKIQELMALKEKMHSKKSSPFS